MGEMVERVAKALAAIEFGHCGGAEALANGKPYWQYRIREARAAIAAMREPTDEMAQTGAPFADDSNGLGSTADAAADCYREMIDEALKP